MSFVDIDFGGMSVVLVTGAAVVVLLRIAAAHAQRSTVDKTRRILRATAKRVGT